MKWYRQILSLPVIAALASVLCGQAFGQGPTPCGEGCCNSGSNSLIVFIGADRDVAGMGRFRSVEQEFASRGYNTVYFDPWKQIQDHEALAGVIRHAVQCRHQRVMLVGWSYGTVVGLKALQLLEREGICVETFVELDCFNLKFYMGDHFHPRNAGRVIVVRSKLNKPAEGYGYAEVHRLESYWHLGVPTHDHTICTIVNEANRLCSGCGCGECGEYGGDYVPGTVQTQSAAPTRARLTLTSANLQGVRMIE